jgi:formyl-CoA transferase
LPARTNAEWLTALHAIDIPACPVNTIQALADDPHLQAVDFFQAADHPTEGTVTVCRPSVRFSRSPASVRRLAPNLGEHNTEVLGAIPPAG